MNRLIVLLLLPLTFSAVAADAPEKASMHTQAGLYVDAPETYAMMTRPEGREVVLIDVRDPVEVKFTGYTDMTNIHVPWKIMDATRWDIFMCRSGSTRSAPAADALYARGYSNVYSMVDGFEGGKAKSGTEKGARVVNGWKNSELPWGWKLDKDVIYGLKQ